MVRSYIIRNRNEHTYSHHTRTRAHTHAKCQSEIQRIRQFTLSIRARPYSFLFRSQWFAFSFCRSPSIWVCNERGAFVTYAPVRLCVRAFKPVSIGSLCLNNVCLIWTTKTTTTTKAIHHNMHVGWRWCWCELFVVPQVFVCVCAFGIEASRELWQ